MSIANIKDKSMIAGVVLIVLSVILVIIFFLKGDVTVIGNYPVNVSNLSLSCTVRNIPYDFHNSYDADFSEIIINMNFGDRSLESISLIYKLYFSSFELVSRASAFLHADMNDSFGKDGYRADSFNATYSIVENVLQMSLYHKGTLETSEQKYFMLNDELTDRDSYLKNYKTKGFSCVNN